MRLKVHNKARVNIERLSRVFPAGKTVEVEVRTEREHLAIRAARDLEVSVVGGSAKGSDGATGGAGPPTFKTVKEARAKVGSMDAAALEAAREAEVAGKDRVGVLDAIDAQLAELE